MYIITQPSIYGVIVYFSLCHESLNYCPVNICDYTMAWFPASLLKAHRRLSTRAITMCVRFVYERRRCAANVKMSHALATLNPYIFVVYGQKHKVWVLVVLVDERNILRPKLGRFCFATKPHRLLQLHSRNAAKYFIKRVG